MSTPPNTQKKSLTWLLMPFGLILLLIGTNFLFQKKSNKSEEVNSSDALIATSSESISRSAVFTVDDFISMVDKNEDFIAGECHKYKFEYSASSENSIFTYKNSEYIDEKWRTTEMITTWRDYPNRLNYCLTEENRYNELVSGIRSRNPTFLNKEQYDEVYPDSVHMVIGNCTFIPIGYKKDFGGFCIVAIRSDHINVAHKSNADSEEPSNSIEGKTFVIKSERSCIYSDHYEAFKTNMFLDRGKKVTYILTEGEFIKCEYENDEGIPIKGYILVNDVGRAE